MKNRKGFTLIEILATVIILGLLLIIGIPTVTKYLNKGKTSYYTSLENQIKASGIDYLETYRTLLPRKVNHVTVIDLEELINNKYIDEVKDEDGNLCTGQVTVKKVKNDSYKYYSCLKCGRYTELQDDGEQYGKYYKSKEEYCNYKETDNVYSDSSDYRIEINEKEVDEGKGYRKYKEGNITVYELPQGEEFELPKAIVYYRQNGEESIVNNNLEGIPSSVNINELTNRKEIIYYHHGAKEKIIVKVIDKTKPSKPQIVLKYNNNKGNDYNLKWTNKNIYAEYKSTDYTKQGVLGSGIDYYEISTDLGKTYQRITGNNTLHTTEGEKTIYVRSVDKMGNRSEANSYTIKIDKKAPTCGLIASGREGNNGWYTDDVTIRYDEGQISGTGSSVLVRVNVEKVTESVKNKVVIGTVTDEAGNTVTCSITVNMDKEVPNGPIIKATDNIESNRWHTEDVTLKLSGASNISGNTYYYKEDSEIELTGTKTRGATINWNKEIENKDYYAIVCSNAGLCSENSNYKIKLDKTKPDCTNDGDSETWINTNRTITYGCSDTLSKCNPNYSGGSVVFDTTTKTSNIAAYTIKDNAGNSRTCAQRTANIYVDKTKPSTPTITNPKEDTWTNNDISLTLSANDKVGTTYTQSGVEKYQYSYNQTTWYDYSSSKPVISEERNATVYIRACDLFQCSDANSTIIKLDKTAPSITKITNPTSENWTNSNFSLTLESSDTGAANRANSGISYYQYKYADTSWKTYSNSNASPFTTTEFSKERDEYVYLNVCDNAGNCSNNENDKTLIKIDKTEPTISNNLADGYYKENKTATITADDTHYSKMQVTVNKNGTKVTAKSNNNVTAKTFDVSLDSEGVWTVIAKAIDAAGNEKSITNTYTIDKTEPTISNNLADGYYKENKTATITANDTHYSKMQVTVNKNGTKVTAKSNNNVTAKTFDVSLDSEGIWTVIAKAIDAAGNEKSITNTYTIDKTKPTCTLKIKSGTEGDNNWYKSDVEIEFNTTDGTGSNIASSTLSATKLTATGTITGTVEDQAGNSNTCSISINIDKVEPECTDSGDSTAWTKNNRTITYGCSDDNSGCNSDYSGGSKQFKVSTITSEIPAYTIKDNAGNSKTCPKRTANVYVDKDTPSEPTITAWKNTSNTSLASGDWSNEWISFKIDGSSSTSDIDYYEYCVDDNNTCTPNQKISTNQRIEATKYIRYRAVNNVKTKGTIGSFLGNIDLIAPTITYSVTGGSYNQNKTITVTAKDSNFDYMHVHVYKSGQPIEAKSVTNSTSPTFNVTLDSDGSYTIYSYVQDKAGNKHNQLPDNGYGWYYQDYSIDTTPPTCTFTGGNKTWTTNEVKVTVTCSDDNGCKDDKKEYTWTFNSGTHSVESLSYTIEDTAGNKKECKENANIYVDKEGPTTPTNGNLGNLSGSNAAAQIVTPASGSTDSGIGNISYLYLIKNDTIAPSKDDTNFTSSRNYTRSCGTVYYAYAIAVDGLGNRSDVKFLGAAADAESSYSEWSTCSKTCGGGTQTRTNACGLITEELEQECNTQSCSYKASSREIEECPANGSYCGEYCSSGCALCYPCPGGTCGCEDDGGYWINLYHGINSSCCTSRTEWYCPDGGTLNNSTKMCEG